MKKAVRILLILLVNFLVLEGCLRLQQMLGPVVDLEMTDMNFDTLSHDLNHLPHPVMTWTLIGHERYGEHAGHHYKVRRDELGVRMDEPPCDWGDIDPVRILFMGDSFVEGYDFENTLVYHARERLSELLGVDAPLEVLNAGHSSYAPCILIPQAKRLIPVLKPDLVVVVVEQSDLGDDNLRYRRLIRWDAAGHIEGVRASPLGLESVRGLIALREAPMYIERLLRKFYHTRVHMPAFNQGYHSWAPSDPLWYAKDRDGSVEKYRWEIAFFTRNVDELIETVVELVGTNRLLLVCHPHLHHLVPEDDGFVWNDFVTPVVAEAVARHDVAFLDAAPGLRARFVKGPEAYYWRGDMHFNFEGFRVYGRLIGERLEPMVTAIWKP